MSGRLLRAVCTTALATALTVSPATVVAAEPGPVPSEETGTAGADTAGEADATESDVPEADAQDADDEAGETDEADEGTAGLGDADRAEVDAGTALAAPEAPRSVVALLRELQTRYQAAEEASETYNATAEKLKQRTSQLRKVNADLAKARAALEASRGDAGRLAREQYQGRTEFSAYLRLLLAHDPQRALDQSHVVGRLAANRAATVDRLTDSAPDKPRTYAGKVKNAQEAHEAIRPSGDRFRTP
ncbi:glycoside hydrolase, partial [Streptomyces sp. NPDC006863]